VLGRVGQRLADHVVGGDLDRARQPLLHLDVQGNRNGAAAGQRAERREQPACRQHGRWMPRAISRSSSSAAIQSSGHALQPFDHVIGPRRVIGPSDCRVFQFPAIARRG